MLVEYVTAPDPLVVEYVTPPDPLVVVDEPPVVVEYVMAPVDELEDPTLPELEDEDE